MQSPLAQQVGVISVSARPSVHCKLIVWRTFTLCSLVMHVEGCLAHCRSCIARSVRFTACKPPDWLRKVGDESAMALSHPCLIHRPVATHDPYTVHSVAFVHLRVAEELPRTQTSLPLGMDLR